MFRRIMVALIRLCSYKGELNTIASSKWLAIASYIIKLVVVLTVVHLFTLYSNTTGMSNLEIIFNVLLTVPAAASQHNA